MKTATFTLTCLPGPAGNRALLSARPRSHTPARRPVTASRRLAAAPDQPAYFEALEGAVARIPRSLSGPRVLHIDADSVTVRNLAALLAPEAVATHAATVAAARELLTSEIFSLVVVDPALPDGDARTLLPLLASTPLLVYSATLPEWRDASPAYLAKPWTSARQLWVAIAGMLGIPASLAAGD